MLKKVLVAGGALWLLPLMIFSQIPYLPGWPQATNGPLTSAINIADVDDDGILELIYGDRSFIGQNDWWLYVKKADGTDAPGWRSIWLARKIHPHCSIQTMMENWKLSRPIPDSRCGTATGRLPGFCPMAALLSIAPICPITCPWKTWIMTAQRNSADLLLGWGGLRFRRPREREVGMAGDESRRNARQRIYRRYQ